MHSLSNHRIDDRHRCAGRGQFVDPLAQMVVVEEGVWSARRSETKCLPCPRQRAHGSTSHDAHVRCSHAGHRCTGLPTTASRAATGASAGTSWPAPRLPGRGVREHARIVVGPEHCDAAPSRRPCWSGGWLRYVVRCGRCGLRRICWAQRRRRDLRRPRSPVPPRRAHGCFAVGAAVAHRFSSRARLPVHGTISARIGRRTADRFTGRLPGIVGSGTDVIRPNPRRAQPVAPSRTQPASSEFCGLIGACLPSHMRTTARLSELGTNTSCPSES